MFDAALKPLSRVEYEQRGARITNERIQNMDGEIVNVLTLGDTYCITYDVEFTEPAYQVRAGCMFKTVEGLELCAVNNTRVQPHPDYRAGDSIEVNILFQCRFMPKTYFLNVGLMSGDKFLHRIVDALAFRVNWPNDEFEGYLCAYDGGLFCLSSKVSLMPSV
jgi:lipopolysaccharide transport system ATP-binding protein